MKRCLFQQPALFPLSPEGQPFGPYFARRDHVDGEESPEGVPAMPGASAEHLRERIRFYGGAAVSAYPTHFQSHSADEDAAPQVIAGQAIHDYALPIPRRAAEPEQ